MNKYQLASILLSYEIDEPHFGEKWNYSPFLPSQIQDWEKEEHCGDCTHEPQPCTKCLIDELLYKAEWLINHLEQMGYKINNV
jgi:hypothetical protein